METVDTHVHQPSIADRLIRSPAVRRALRLPSVLDELGLGRVLGDRVVIIDHVGRRTGRLHRTALEVVVADPAAAAWTVIAAWRPHPDWLANIEAEPARAIAVAGRRHPHPHQRILDPDERLDALAAYGVAHPVALRGLSRLLDWEDPRHPGALRRIADDHVMVMFTPRAAAGTSPR